MTTKTKKQAKNHFIKFKNEKADKLLNKKGEKKNKTIF